MEEYPILFNQWALKQRELQLEEEVRRCSRREVRNIPGLRRLLRHCFWHWRKNPGESLWKLSTAPPGDRQQGKRTSIPQWKKGEFCRQPKWYLEELLPKSLQQGTQSFHHLDFIKIAKLIIVLLYFLIPWADPSWVYLDFWLTETGK